MQPQRALIPDFSRFYRHIPHLRLGAPKRNGAAGDLRGLELGGLATINDTSVDALERALVDRLFGGQGGCVAVANTTLGLMLSIRHAAAVAGRPGGFALMPSFAPAAVAQAALWAGLTPLLCDIDPRTWSASPAAEAVLLARFGAEISVVVPCATFGNCLDLDRYADVAQAHGVGVVVDAGVALGARDAFGDGFGTGSTLISVFSVPGTKPFAAAAGGIIQSGDPALVATLRQVVDEGVAARVNDAAPRLHARMSGTSAQKARDSLDRMPEATAHQAGLAARYRARLEAVTFQQQTGQQQAHPFMPVLLPSDIAARRGEIVSSLAMCGINTGTYLSPHIAEHPLFHGNVRAGLLTVTEDIAARILVLPMTEEMDTADVDEAADALNETIASLRARRARRAADRIVAEVPFGADA
jgi:dTDP-4-amino-4,6-dideoxygalactose transaminase